MNNLRIGQILKVINAPTQGDYYGLNKGDYCTVAGIYPHVILVHRIGGGFLMRQCFKRNCWWHFLKKV